MDIIVCIKQVPDTTDVKIDPVTNTLIRSGVPSIVNPFDENAVEAGLQLKEKYGGTVTVLSMGPPQAKAALKECLAMGADKAYLISDRAFGGADTLATSYTLAAMIRKLGKFDVIICGKQAIDGDTAQVGPEIAEHLDISQVTYVFKVRSVENGVMTVEKEHDDGYEVIEAKLPTMITVLKSTNVPRYPTIKSKMAANKAEIPTITAADLDVVEECLGLKGSPTKVKKIFSPERRGAGMKIENMDGKEAALKLAKLLNDAKVI